MIRDWCFPFLTLLTTTKFICKQTSDIKILQTCSEVAQTKNQGAISKPKVMSEAKHVKKLYQLPTTNNNCRLPISQRFFIGLFRRHAWLVV